MHLNQNCKYLPNFIFVCEESVVIKSRIQTNNSDIYSKKNTLTSMMIAFIYSSPKLSETSMPKSEITNFANKNDFIIFTSLHLSVHDISLNFIGVSSD